MNRLPATGIDSDDSDSDWDSTVAENFQQKSSGVNGVGITLIGDGDYATIVKPKPRTSLKESEQHGETSPVEKESPLPKHQEDLSRVSSPPPHMTTFQKAMTDYPSSNGNVSESRPVDFEKRGKLYRIPEGRGFPANDKSPVNWDDSDAEERTLRELQQSREKERQRQQAIKDRKAAADGERSATPVSSRSIHTIETSPEMHQPPFTVRRDRQTVQAQAMSPGAAPSVSHQMLVPAQNVKEQFPVLKQTNTTDLRSSQTVFVKNEQGKKGILYFDQGTAHYLEIIEDDVDAYLPEVVDKVDLLFRRIWREVFSLLRLVTSFFVLMVVEFFHFLMQYVITTLIYGILVAIGNHFLKPVLTALFNFIVQPLMAFTWNVLSGVYHAFQPVVNLLGDLFSKFAILLSSFRLVSLNWNYGAPVQRSEDASVKVV